MCALKTGHGFTFRPRDPDKINRRPDVVILQFLVCSRLISSRLFPLDWFDLFSADQRLPEDLPRHATVRLINVELCRIDVEHSEKSFLMGLLFGRDGNNPRYAASDRIHAMIFRVWDALLVSSFNPVQVLKHQLSLKFALLWLVLSHSAKQQGQYNQAHRPASSRLTALSCLKS